MKPWVAGCLAVGLLTAVTPLRSNAVPVPAVQKQQGQGEGKGKGKGGQREAHPQINAAIRALENAKDHLQKAAHDFGGHRVEAIAAIDKALEQLRLALQFDKN